MLFFRMFWEKKSVCPLTVDEIPKAELKTPFPCIATNTSPPLGGGAKKQIKLKQIFKGDKNLPKLKKSPKIIYML